MQAQCVPSRSALCGRRCTRRWTLALQCWHGRTPVRTGFPVVCFLPSGPSLGQLTHRQTWNLLLARANRCCTLTAGAAVCIRCCRRLNALDVQLYQHAQQLMTQQRQRLEASGNLQLLPPKAPTKHQGQHSAGSKSAKAVGAAADGSNSNANMHIHGLEGMDETVKQRLQGQVMQQLQKWLSRKGTSE